MKQLLPLKEAASELEMSESTLYRRAKIERKISYFQDGKGKRLRFRRETIDAYRRAFTHVAPTESTE